MRERRKHERIQIQQPIRVESLGADYKSLGTHTCRVLDISSGGAQIESPSELVPGSRIRLWVTFDSFLGKISVAPYATVKWAKKSATPDRFLIGVEISSTATEDTKKWAQYARKKNTVIL